MESLDEQIMTFAASLEVAGNGDAADELRSYAATIRETWRGTHAGPTLADTLESLADAASEATRIIQEHTPHSAG